MALLAIVLPYALGVWLILTEDDFIPYPDGPPPGQQTAPRARPVVTDIGGIVVTLPLPIRLAASAQRGGLSIRRRDEGGRLTYGMSLARAVGPSPLPLDRTRGHGPAAIHYGVKQEAVGSGGDDVMLVAERRCGAVTLRLRLDTQAEEGGIADLEPAFDLLAGATCTAARSRPLLAP